jgi:hypothetical protein
MITDATLDLAVAQGHISADQAQKLRAIEAQSGGFVAESPDEEKLRFVTGFADIFVTIGLGLFLGASGYFIQNTAGATAMWLGVAVLSWLLAEFFTRLRRLALPSIVLLATFVLSSFEALIFLLVRAFWGGGSLGLFDVSPNFPVPEIAGLGAAALAGVHYWRFRVPITIAAGVAALCLAPIGLIAEYAVKTGVNLVPAATLICGLVVFVLAMRFDMSDPERQTRRTDIAFWLHLLAAPLIVHSLIGKIIGAERFGEPNAGQSIAVLCIFAALGLVAIVIDRRAILVSGLVYAGVAFSALIRQSGVGATVLPATLLVLGICVLMLSAFWRPLRRAVLSLVPSRFARRLPHSVSIDS